jgi:hypothetical protein
MIVVVRLTHESGASTEVSLDDNEMRELSPAAFQAILDTAGRLSPGQRVLRMTYVDDEGDHCSLSAETIADALSFVEPCGEGVGILPLTVKTQAEVPAAESSGTTMPAGTPVCQEGDLAVHGNVVCDVSGMFPILGKRYKKKGEDYDLCEEEFRKLPKAAKAAFVCIARPGDTPVPVETAECREHEELPVHHGIWCDVSGMHPIGGARYNKKGEDYDLCEEEFRKLPVDAQAAFVCIARPGESPVPVGAAWCKVEGELPVHHGIWCDVSGMHPIVGVRYNKKGKDYDLCESEFLKLPEATKQAFQRIDWPGAPPSDAMASTSAVANSSNNAEVMAGALERLLQHPNPAVQNAAQKALDEAAATAQLLAVSSMPSPCQPIRVVHEGVICDASGMNPILGVRYKKRDEDYDLCEAEFHKLAEKDKAAFVRIDRPCSHAIVEEELATRHGWDASDFAKIVDSPLSAEMQSILPKFPHDRLAEAEAALEPAFSVPRECVALCLHELHNQIVALRPVLESALAKGDAEQALMGLRGCVKNVVERAGELGALTTEELHKELNSPIDATDEVERLVKVASVPGDTVSDVDEAEAPTGAAEEDSEWEIVAPPFAPPSRSAS